MKKEIKNSIPMTPQIEMVQRAKKYMADNKKLLDKYGISQQVVISFSKLKKVPFLSKIALKILHIQGGVPDIRFQINKQ